MRKFIASAVALALVSAGTTTPAFAADKKDEKKAEKKADKK